MVEDFGANGEGFSFGYRPLESMGGGHDRG